MPVTGDKFGYEWKVVKNDKSKKNTNKTSAYSIPSKVPSPVNLQNRFSSLMVTEERSIENESQVQTPTNYHQRIEIQNTKSKSRAEKIKSSSIRTTVANYNNAQIENPVVTVPGNRPYSSTTKFGKKICVVGDSHIRRIKRNLFNNSLCEGKAHLNGFNGANIKRLDHFITPTLVEDRPDIVIIHIGSNDITHNTVDQIDMKDIENRIINTGKKCLSYGIKKGVIWSIFIKKQCKLTRIIRQVNDLLCDECKRNYYQFISSDSITREVLWRDDLHLNNDGTYIFVSNLVDFLNDFIFSKSI